MHDMLTARRAELVAAREQNGQRQAELRAALTQAERNDYAYAAAIGEIERLLEQIERQSPGDGVARSTGATQGAAETRSR